MTGTAIDSGSDLCMSMTPVLSPKPAAQFLLLVYNEEPDLSMQLLFSRDTTINQVGLVAPLQEPLALRLSELRSCNRPSHQSRQHYKHFKVSFRRRAGALYWLGILPTLQETDLSVPSD
eukprot:Plantae.Rhodophyta-Rhodochaete_pulchella.ctg10892.p1 GENE.Plantae.Rhodophyta-Rhodochaete_pulchella.ctg10892~~Plantae.Rhodophyta-Rhodochaete_pulchella.ctg10892.p1  ORF type:complete len:119 (-),score=7.05 Plantae.Rhodophyta-Rhodochaete_pulchella.ctg10892:682-1038(-)